MSDAVRGGDAWRDAAAIARDGRWASWPGLPAGLPVATVLAELASAAAPPAVASSLGRRPVDRHDAPPLKAWAEGDAVVLVEWLDPPCATSVAELLDALGPAEREGPGRHLRSGATTTERVYPARGLALTIAESYDQPPGFAPYLATVQLFVPASLRDFVLELGGNDHPGRPRMIDPRRR